MKKHLYIFNIEKICIHGYDVVHLAIIIIIIRITLLFHSIVPLFFFFAAADSGRGLIRCCFFMEITMLNAICVSRRALGALARRQGARAAAPASLMQPSLSLRSDRSGRSGGAAIGASFAAAAAAVASHEKVDAFETEHVVTSRVMLPDDANPAGNVHGGTILKMIEQAGYIAATKYTNRNSKGDASFGVVARIDHMDFLCPNVYWGTQHR